jgi:orotate phosphoribosyltransferase-like protein
MAVPKGTNLAALRAANQKLIVKCRELREQRLSLRQIGEKLGLTKSRVNYLLYGIKHQQKVAKESLNGHSENVGTDGNQEAAIAFAAGHCVAWLEVYAHSQQIPGAVLASRVGKLLQAGKNR